MQLRLAHSARFSSRIRRVRAVSAAIGSHSDDARKIRRIPRKKLDRLIAAVSRLAPRGRRPGFRAADCFVWAADPGFLEPVHRVNRVDIGLIRGVDRVRDILVDNTGRFAAGLPANNVLLWGARGMGKSSLVKAVHATINAARQGRHGRSS